MRLTDCFMDVLAYMAYFLRGVAERQPSYDQVRTDVLRLLSQSEQHVRSGAVPEDDYVQARFAVCAWVDEAILGSPWEHRARWQTEQLQRVFYRTTEAGEEFFDRLNNIGLHQRNLREIYYLALALGFKGRYLHESDDVLLDQLKSSNLKLLLGSSLGVPSLDRGPLFAEAYPAVDLDLGGKPSGRFGFSVPTLVGVAAPVVFFLLLYWVFSFVLGGVSSNFLQAGT